MQQLFQLGMLLFYDKYYFNGMLYILTLWITHIDIMHYYEWVWYRVRSWNKVHCLSYHILMVHVIHECQYWKKKWSI